MIAERFFAGASPGTGPHELVTLNAKNGKVMGCRPVIPDPEKRCRR